MKNPLGLRTWIELNKDAVDHNISVIKDLISPQVSLGAVVKSNAYGHGLVDFCNLIAKDVDWLIVDSIVEGIRLRKEGFTLPMLVLGYTLPEMLSEAVEYNLSLTISSLQSLKLLSELEDSAKVKIHLKIDTGLHRQGFLLQEQQSIIDFLAQHKQKISVEGMYTHFAKAKDPNDRSYTEQQIAEFNTWVEKIKELYPHVLVHASASASAFLYPEAHYDMVRVGAALYGVWPSEHVKEAFSGILELKPVLSWHTIIGEIKSLPQGSGIGYDLSDILNRDSVVAVCPVGYWHGLSRLSSSQLEVVVGKQKVKELGRIAMDMISIDVTDVPDAHVGAKVTLIGGEKPSDKTQIISAFDIAQTIGTTTYEILTRLNPLIQKIITTDEK